MSNDDLARYAPSGASRVTADQDRLPFAGRRASEAMAQTDMSHVMRFRSRFDAVGVRLSIPPALLAGIASRETRGGQLLDAQGFGDHGNAFGIMQVDKRHHQIVGTSDPGSEAHIEQATRILADFAAVIAQHHQDWPAIRRLQGAVAAYNVGPDNVRTLDGMDRGTTGDDYSNDVWARALFYAARWQTPA